MAPGCPDEMTRLALALVCALAAGMLVRDVTLVLNRTAGEAWPFVLARCVTPDTPGCRPSPTGPHRVPWP